ncbi:hypothetical protein NAEGRDRAFT_78593 [Naegleria gruberi]|uniref:F-box domain-containing protein n=1 Tax=Naegleria gruberi TaxID=5762 RepID=D2V4S8_NAEGR|nr:uncharacterized protein NAEGRDRAFT_78593 [Naegleria gruberi]EFC47987.1 hypothetical protein NAEGRDRAFT_78593 [Naegleria gruberi]|eukprot:XP_002680731.1 hypothetical protein NAEGRDRAFT_78593 [Naegleria gruberi strain NEG-M]
MPCSTNNDPNALFYDLTDSFSAERQLFTHCIQNDEILNNLIMFSSIGQIVPNLYIGYEQSDHTRYPKDEDDIYNDILDMDGLKSIRVKLKNVKLVPDDGLVVRSCNGYSTIQFNPLEIHEKELTEFEFEKKGKVPIMIEFKKENTQIHALNQDLLCYLFQFVDTKSLLANYSQVCSNWFRMIYFDKSNAMNYLFENRTVSFFEKRGASSETIHTLKRLNERYQLDWLETYMMSGMFHFEMDGEEIMDELQTLLVYSSEEKSFFYTSIILDPLQYLRDVITEDHILFEKLSKHTRKVVSVSKNCISSAIDQHILNGFVSNLVGLDSTDDNVLSIVERILLSPCTTPLAKDQLSIDIKKSIPFYIDFLRELRKKLIISFANEYKHTSGLCNLEPLNFGKLLENRKLYNSSNESSLENVDSYLPATYRVDLMHLLLNGKKGNTESEPLSLVDPHLFLQPIHAIQFLKEHIIDLSKVMDTATTEIERSEWIDKYSEEYRIFISTIHEKSITPPKQVDLFFHLHMLHPNNFIQDCQRLAKSIKEHQFNFEWQKNEASREYDE